MRVRLFKLGRNTQPLALGLGALSWLVLSGGCGGKEFSASPNTSGSGQGSAGAGSGGVAGGAAGAEPVSEAGEAGSDETGSSGAPSAGSGGELNSAGSAGKPVASCDCSAGEYCQDGTGTCRKCAEFARLEFGAAQKLTTLAQGSQSSERFPRTASAGSALFYVSGAPDNSKIMYAATPVSGVGVPVSIATQVDSGPLYVAGFAEQNLFFDRRQGSERRLMMALWSAPALLIKEQLVPEPINAPGFDDYSIAVSPNTGHVYWMSTRNGQAELLWQATSSSAPTPPAVLELKIRAGTAECARTGEDATPWVNVAGTLLLIRNPSLNDDCEPNDSGATDLFAAPLAKDGTPLAPAISLGSLNTLGGMSRETDPSLSPDSCFIYFASDNGTGNFDLYKAPRR
jgi:WD40 repeat protein